MKSKMFFRESGYVIPTRPRISWPGWLWPMNLVAAVIALYGLVGYLDDRDHMMRTHRATELAQARSEGFDAGRQVGEAHMVDSARAAWQAALTEAEQRCVWRRP